MKYVLNLDEKDTNETFYRYLITTDDDKPLMVIWFGQYESGNIYNVYAATRCEELEPFEVWFDIPFDGPYKPSGWYFRLKSTNITNENFNQIHSGMQMLQYACNTAMQIFEDKEHKK